MEHFVRMQEIVEKIQEYIGKMLSISTFYLHVKVFYFLTILTYIH